MCMYIYMSLVHIIYRVLRPDRPISPQDRHKPTQNIHKTTQSSTKQHKTDKNKQKNTKQHKTYTNKKVI